MIQLFVKHEKLLILKQIKNTNTYLDETKLRMLPQIVWLQR